MMDNVGLKAILAYIVGSYPAPSDLSNSRLTKLVFLSDWKQCLKTGRYCSGIKWYFDHYGPYVDDVINLAKSDSDFLVSSTKNDFGGAKNVISLAGGYKSDFHIDSSLKESIDFVVNLTKDKKYDEFIDFVYSTYPVVTAKKYSGINLEAKAEEYKKLLSPSKD